MRVWCRRLSDGAQRCWDTTAFGTEETMRMAENGEVGMPNSLWDALAMPKGEKYL